MRSLPFLFSLIVVVSCSTISKKSSNESLVTMFEMTNSPVIGTTLSGQKIHTGGYSGLQFLEQRDGALFFQTISDRGPTSPTDGVEHIFLLPEFTPTITTLKADLNTKELAVTEELKLKRKDGRPLTGLPNRRLEENPQDVFGLYYSIDPEGVNSEALTLDGEGGWWIADEYGPSLISFDREGKMLQRLTPENGLPRLYGYRAINQGFSAIAKTPTKIYGFLQSPLPKEKASDDNNARIVEVDLETLKTSAEYFYSFEKGNDRIGDAVAINSQYLLVIEQNGRAGKPSQKYIFLIKLGGSDQIVQKKLVADLKSTPFNNLEKIEGLTIIDNRHLALISNNDFKLTGKTDLKTGLTPINEIKNQLLVVELKESLDASIFSK